MGSASPALQPTPLSHHLLHYIYTCYTCHLYTSHLLSHLSLWLPNPIHTQTLILMRSVKQLDSQWTRSSVSRSASTCSTRRRLSSSLQMTSERSMRMVLERLKSENSANYARHSWWRILIWRPWRELKDAFRIYDKEGLGYITTETLRGLISELLAPLSEEELEGIL